MKTNWKLALLSLVIVSLTGVLAVQAEDAKASATGTWKWSTPGRNGGTPRERTLKLKQDGEKVTGTISGFGQNATDIEIADGSIKDGTITFKTTFKRNETEIVTTYTGKLDGDTIKFSAKSTGGNQDRPAREFEAKRSKD